MTKKQIISEANKIRSEYRRIKLDDIQKKFIKWFIKKHKKLVLSFLILTVIEALISLSLPIITHFYLEQSFQLMIYHTFWTVSIILLVLIVIFLINSYYRIYIGQKGAMFFVNEIREAWYSYFLKHSSAFRNSFDGRKLMTKFLYHVQLLKMGLQNVLTEGLEAIFLYIGLLIVSFFFNPNLFLVLWVSLPLLLIIFFITDFIGRFYVAREQTFNSRIVSLLADSLINFNIIKSQNREQEKLKELDNLIDLDTYFRIRRQLWLKYSQRLLYGMILLFGVLLYFMQIYWPFFDIGSLTSIASTGIILGFFIRIMFITSRAGIFYEAFRLGLVLSVPKFKYFVKKVAPHSPEWKTLKISGKKTKLSKYGDYLKYFELVLNRGDRISIISKGSNGKTTLAKVLTGHKCIDSLIFNIKKRRILSKKWCSYKNENYFITGNPQFDTTVGEYLLGKNKSSITSEDIVKVFELLKSYKLFDFLFNHNNALGRLINSDDLSLSEVVLLQIAHCILNKKKIIAIDHTCIDTDDELVSEGVELLDRYSKKSVILAFSTEKNKYFKYDKTFKLSKGKFQEV